MGSSIITERIDRGGGIVEHRPVQVQQDPATIQSNVRRGDVVQGRLTLQSGVPVPNADQTGKSTLYFTPFGGDLIALWDGTRWKLFQFSELSLDLSSAGENILSGKNYDVWAVLSGGVPVLELSAAWTNNTTRAEAVSLVDGRYTKTGDKTRLYLGTIRASANEQCEDSKTKRFVWNYHNRVPRSLVFTVIRNSWTYGTAAWRQTAADATHQVSVVVGINEDVIELTGLVMADVGATEQYLLGIGLDSSTVNVAQLTSAPGLGTSVPTSCSVRGRAGVGYHEFRLLEYAISGTITVYGDNGGTVIETGLIGVVRG